MLSRRQQNNNNNNNWGQKYTRCEWRNGGGTGGWAQVGGVGGVGGAGGRWQVLGADICTHTNLNLNYAYAWWHTFNALCSHRGNNNKGFKLTEG